MSGRGSSLLILLALAWLVTACSDGHRADLSQIPDPFPTDIDDINVQAVSNADFDVNGDGVVGRCDYDMLRRSYGSDRLERDLDGDGVVGPEDALAWLTANRNVLPPRLTDEAVVDGIRWFYGNQLVVLFDAEAPASSEDPHATEIMLTSHGLIQLSENYDVSHPLALVQTPDRDLPRHIQALASEPLVASINLNHFTTIMRIEPQGSQQEDSDEDQLMPVLRLSEHHSKSLLRIFFWDQCHSDFRAGTPVHPPHGCDGPLPRLRHRVHRRLTGVLVATNPASGPAHDNQCVSLVHGGRRSR